MSARRGAFKTGQYGLRFLYRHTLGRTWRLFGEKRIASPRQKRLPEALSEDQVRHLFSAIDRANQVLRIVGRGNKERLVPLPQPILDELGHLWRTHRNHRWLFPNWHGDAPVNKRVLSDSFAARCHRGRHPSWRDAVRAAPQLCDTAD